MRMISKSKTDVAKRTGAMKPVLAKSTAYRFKHKQSGTTLIEILVSVFVFAVGVLGYAALQGKSIQNNVDLVQREEVVWMVDGLVSRIRVNRRAAADYLTEINGFQTCPANAPVVCGAGQLCSQAAQAQFDVYDVLCGNELGGADLIQDFSIAMNCVDAFVGGADTDACSSSSNVNLELSWCSLTVENEDAIAQAAGRCSTPVAQQTYTVSFRP